MGKRDKPPSVPKALPHPASHRLRLAASQAIPTVVAVGVLYAIKEHFWRLPPDDPLRQSGILGCMMGQVGVLLMSKPFLGQTMAVALQRGLGTCLGGFTTLALQQASPHWALMGSWLALITAGAATAATVVPQALVLLQVTVGTAYVVAIQSTYLVLKGQAAYAFALPKVLGLLAGAGLLLVAQLLTFPRTATHQLMYSLNRCLDHTAQLAAALASRMPHSAQPDDLDHPLLDEQQASVLEVPAADGMDAVGRVIPPAPSSRTNSKDHLAAAHSSSYSARAGVVPGEPARGLPLDSGMSVRLPPGAVRLLADVWQQLGRVESLLGVARHEVLLGQVGRVRLYTVRLLAGPSPLPRALVRQLVVQLRAMLRLLLQWDMEAGINPAAQQVPPFLAQLLEGQGQDSGTRLGVVLVEALQELVGGIPLSAGPAPPLPRARLDALEQRLAHLVSGLLELGAVPGAGVGCAPTVQLQQQQQQPQQQQQRADVPGTDQPAGHILGHPQGLASSTSPADSTAGPQPAVRVESAGYSAEQQPSIGGREQATSPTPDELVGLMRCFSNRSMPSEQQGQPDDAIPVAVSAQLAQQLFRQDSQQPAAVRAATWYTLLLVWRTVVLLEKVHDTLHQLRRQLPGVSVSD